MIKTKLNRKNENGGIETSLRDRMPFYIMLAPFMIFFCRTYSFAYDSLSCAELF